MKFNRFRTKLLAYFWIILIIALGMPSYYIYRTLTRELIDEEIQSAFAELDLVAWLINRQGPFENDQALHDWCAQVAEKLDYRITVISARGRVVADSSEPFDEIQRLENHADRGEFIGARQNGRASSIRYSVTVKRKLIYAAKSVHIPGMPESVLRVAVPMSLVESRLAYFAHRFWLVLIIFLLIAGFLNYLLARNLEAPIKKIIRSLRAIGEGKYDEYVEVDSGDEFSELADGINETTGKIRRNIEQISQQKDELEAVLEGMREGVMLLDESGKIKASNESLSRLSRIVSACTGRRPIEVFLNPELQAACDEVLQGKNYIRLMVTIEEKSAYEVNVVRIDSGGAVVVFHDISELVRLEKVRQDFVANVSHELRTPLTSIRGYSETLLDKKMGLPERAENFLQIIFKNASQMANIVNDLLELTKLQQKDRQPLELTAINAISCFKAAWETCLPLADTKRIRLENRLPESLPVMAEENSLAQVFRNILDNAIRHSSAETAITVFADLQKHRIRLGIQDQGPGIAKQHQKRIFERFYRVDKERSRTSGGTGLGLSICRNAVQAMNGEIWVESPPADKTEGSVFFFTLDKAGDIPGSCELRNADE